MYKRIAIIVTIIALLGVYILWGMDYIYALTFNHSAAERDQLEADLANTRKALENRIVIDADFPQQVEDARQELETEMALVPESVDIPGLIEEMLLMSEDYGIEIIPLRTADWSRSSRPGYEVYQIQILVAGDATAITDYVNLLEATGPTSLISTNLQLQGESIGPAGETWPVEGSLTVSVYRRVDPGATS